LTEVAEGAGTAEVLVTASEGFPALERLFLGARREIWAGFRIFDLTTRLRSEAGRAIGETWFDLIVERLRAGIAIRMLLADFDPCLALGLHVGTCRSLRQFAAARETAGTGRLDVRAALHPARAGGGPRLLFWPMVLAHARNDMEDQPATLWRGLPCTAAGLAPRLGPAAGAGPPPLAPWPPPVVYPATHHQKLAVADRSRLFIGGLDLDERRYDDPDHRRPAEETWQDVALVLGGDVATAAQAHLEALWNEGPPPPAHRPADPAAPVFLRTLSRDGSGNPLRLAPRPLIREIEAEHRALFGRARRLIYIETQYFRSRAIARALARAALANPALTLILMLPAAPDDVAFEGARGLDARFGEYLQVRCIAAARRAFGGRAFIGMPLRRARRNGPGRDSALGAEIVYIHSKVAIADDAEAIVSSANLNGRSLRWDTEAGVALREGEVAARLRSRLFEHWLPQDAEDALHDTAHAVKAWAALAAENAALPPERRRGFLLPYDPRPAASFGAPAPGLPEELV
jgi:phospholipase D1/2